jgi:hypothetical protein
LQEFNVWYRAFLAKRGLDKPNGHMLFRYRTTQDEYHSIRDLFSKKLEELAGRPWILTSYAERALFVLYASEWWRREYAGGAWSWTQIIQSITSHTFNLDVIERTDSVELGLRVWGHRPSLDGKKYLGAIVAQGGLPLKMIAQGDGAVTKLLVRAMRHAQLLGWDEERLEHYFSAHQIELVQHLRATEIFKLLASVIWTVLELRNEFKLAGATNPIEILDKVQSNWRERFPIAADDRSAEPLLTGLVKEASRVIKVINTYPTSIIRTIVRHTDSDEFDLVMSIQMSSNITLDALALAFGVSPNVMPQTFSIELVGNHRSTLGSGRQLLGGQEASVMLTGKPRRFVNREAQAEVLMVLRGLGSDLHAPVAIPGGDELDDDEPWVFTNRESEYALIDIGSCNLPDEVCFIAVPDNFSVVANQGYVKKVGTISRISKPRDLYEVQGRIRIIDESYNYEVNTSNTSNESVQFIWRGSRLPYRTSPLPVYLGVPKLFKLDLEGLLHPVNSRDIDWIDPSNGTVVPLNGAHKGPIDAWLKKSEVRQRRFRMVLIPNNARVRFISGSTVSPAEIVFLGWGINELQSTEDLQANVDLQTDLDSAKIVLKNQVHPPSKFDVAMTWPNVDHILQINVPYPTTGGRFSIGTDDILLDQSTLPIRKLEVIQLHVYDSNPDTPKKYALSIELSGSNVVRSYHRLSVPVPLDVNGFGQIRLFEIEASLYDLICQSDSLDAKLILNLCVGQSNIQTLFLTRYDTFLENEVDSYGLTSEVLASTSLETRLGIRLRAIPLLKPDESDLEVAQVFSEGVPAGRWNAGLLTQQNSPWLIYPAIDSTLQIRPTVYVKSEFDALTVLNTKACPLAIAMSGTIQRDRDSMIKSVVSEMAKDFDHKSWQLVLHQHIALSHLPLATLDYWRAFGSDHEASFAVLLKLVSDIPALMQRMHNELGVVWELTPNQIISNALKRFSATISKQLNVEVGSEMHKNLVLSLFKKIGQGSTSLATQVDLILFQEGFGNGAHFTALIQEFRKTPQSVLQNLWKGPDSMLQRILLRAHSEDSQWPHFDMTETLIQALMRECVKNDSEYLNKIGRDLIWSIGDVGSGSFRKNMKADVANGPFLAALLVQFTGSSNYLQETELMAQLRQIRAFDSVWFDVAIKAAGLVVALKVPPVAINPNMQRAPRP